MTGLMDVATYWYREVENDCDSTINSSSEEYWCTNYAKTNINTVHLN